MHTNIHSKIHQLTLPELREAELRYDRRIPESFIEHLIAQRAHVPAAAEIRAKIDQAVIDIAFHRRQLAVEPKQWLRDHDEQQIERLSAQIDAWHEILDTLTH